MKAKIREIISKNPRLRNTVLKSKGIIKNTKPSFLIPGIEKCGTTSLFYYLIQHEQIQEPLTKEIYFFDQNYDKGLNWYKGHYQGFTFDSTPTYYRELSTIKLIKKHLPKSKFIIILRNPIKRIISAWNMCLNENWDKRTLEQIIKYEQDPSIHGYLYQSRYVERLEDWFSVFPNKKQTHLLTLENLQRQPNKELNKIFSFLKLRPQKINSLKIHNKGKHNFHPSKNTLHFLNKYFKPYNKKLEEKFDISFGGYNE